MKKIVIFFLIIVIFKSILKAQVSAEVYNLINKSIVYRVDNKLNNNIGIAVVGTKTTQYFIYSGSGITDSYEFDINSLLCANGVYNMLQDFYYSELISHYSIDFNLPIQEYLPKGSKAVSKILKKITLADLMLSTSGLSCAMKIDSLNQIDNLFENCINEYPSGSFYEKNKLMDLFKRHILEKISGLKEIESINNAITRNKLNHTSVIFPQNNIDAEVKITLKDLSKIVAIELGILDKQIQPGLVKLREIQQKAEFENSYYSTTWVKSVVNGVCLYVVEFQQDNNHFMVAFNPLQMVGVVAISDIIPIHDLVFSILTETSLEGNIVATKVNSEIVNITGEYYNDLLEAVSIFKKHDKLYAYISKVGVYELFNSGGGDYYTIIPGLNLTFKFNSETNEQVLLIQHHQEYRKK